MPAIMQSPHFFNGTLDQLYDDHAKSVLIGPDQVAKFHRALITYLETEDCLYLVRQVTGMTRGQRIQLKNGFMVKATDNSPSWYTHCHLYSSIFSDGTNFARFIDAVPCHMFQVDLPQNISKAGWHVAHLFDAKDGDTSFQNWDQKQLIKRMVRSIHPCNYFYIPKANWQRHGGEKDVLSYFYEKFSALYSDIWKEFLDLAKAQPIKNSLTAKSYKYSISSAKSDLNKSKPIISNITNLKKSPGKKPKEPERVLRQLDEVGKIVTRLPVNEKTDRVWCFRDDNNQHYHGNIPENQKTVTLMLNWKPDVNTNPKPVGSYQLDLPSLLSAGYVKKQATNFILRFQRTGDNIEVAVNRRSPALVIGRKPAAG